MNGYSGGTIGVEKEMPEILKQHLEELLNQESEKYEVAFNEEKIRELS